MDQNHVIEIIPQQIFETMKYDIFTDYKNTFQSLLDAKYIKQRKEIFESIHKLSNKLGFKSQTFFLTTYYLDLILLQYSMPSHKYFLLALGCLVIASKYSENDPVVPPLENFIVLFNKIKKMDSPVTFEQLYKMEVKICKLLKYNLHYVTSYDFDFFFFNHGIIKKEQIIEILSIDNDDNETDKEFVLDGNYVKKILEKIYRKSRSFLNLVIYNDTLCFKYNSLLLSIYIMKKSVEFVILNEYKDKNNYYYNIFQQNIIIKTDNYFKEIMDNFYSIDYESSPNYQELIKDKEIINIFPQNENINTNNISKKNIIENNNDNPATSATLDDVHSSNKLLKSMTLKNNYKVINSKINIKKALNGKKSYYNSLFNKNNHENQIERYGKNINKNNSTTKYQKIKINIKKDFSMCNKHCIDRYSNINFSDYKSLCKLNIFTEKSIDKSNHFNDSHSLEKFSYNNNKISVNNIRPHINDVKLVNSNSNIYRYSTIYNDDKNKSVEKNNEVIVNKNNKNKPYFKKVIHNNVMKTANKKAVVTGLISKTNTIKNEYGNNLTLSINTNKKKKNRFDNNLNSGYNKSNINDENNLFQTRKTLDFNNQIFKSQEKSKEKKEEKLKKKEKSVDKNNNINSNTNIIYNYYFSNNNYYTNNKNIENSNNNIKSTFYKNKIGSEPNILTNISNSNANFSIGSSRKSATNNNFKKNSIVNMKYCNFKNGQFLNNEENNNHTNLRKNISPKSINKILSSESFYRKKNNDKNFTGMKNKMAVSKDVRNTINSMKNLDSNSSTKKSKNFFPLNKNSNYQKKLLKRFVKKNTFNFNTIDTYNNFDGVNNIKQNLNFDNEDGIGKKILSIAINDDNNINQINGY